jgi:hypothetical protein
MSKTERSFKDGIYLETSLDYEQVLRRARELEIAAEVRQKIESVRAGGDGESAQGLVTKGRLCLAGVFLISRPLLLVVFGSCKPRKVEALSDLIRERVEWVRKAATGQ